MKTTRLDAIPDAHTKARLEFHCEKIAWEEYLVRYELVLPLDEADCRGTFDHKPGKYSLKKHNTRYLSKDNCLRFPLGGTTVGTSSATYPFHRNGEINLPFRDGVHCEWDNKKLGGLALYYVTEDGSTYLLEKEIPAAVTA